MSTQVQLRRDSAANVAAFTGKPGEVIVDTTNNRLCLQDGATAGRLSGGEALRGGHARRDLAARAGAAWRWRSRIGCLEQLVTLSGATTDSTAQIPRRRDRARRLQSRRHGDHRRDLVQLRLPGVGASRQFGSSLGVSAGSTNLGLIGPNPFYTATSVRYTAAGGSFTGGAVRMTIHYLMPNVATS